MKTGEVLRDLFQKERDELNAFFDQINLVAIEQAVDMLQACTGMIILSGVGKSGLIAEKIAQTMTSTGTRALFLPPANALHGDIGLVQSNDLVVLFSKSGESDELLHLMPFIRNRQTKIIAIVNSSNSRLAKGVDLCIHLPMETELCPFNLAPTISPVVQMIVGDVLAISLMIKKGFTSAEYARNHPSGRIGRRLSYLVKDLMITEKKVPTALSTDLLTDVLVELSNKQCGCVLIVDKNNHLMGIFTDGDLRRTLQKWGSKSLEIPMSEIMTSGPRTISPDKKAIDALYEMESDKEHPITVLAVVNGSHQVVGLIKMHDLIQIGL